MKHGYASPRAFLKRLLYGSGLLGLYHRVRNRKTLTVVMFHRVLDPRDRRWHSCDPDYTISADLFRQCLELLARHYTIVGMDDVLASAQRAAPLPPRALLLTFDDGWQDNYEYALPVLRAMKLPAAIFVVAEAVDSASARFQERIIAGWRRGSLGPTEIRAMSELTGIPAGPDGRAADLASVRRLIAALEALDAGKRDAIVARFDAALADDDRHNLSAAELREMSRSGFAIGTHGLTHAPLTRVASVAEEVTGARRQLSSALGASPGAIDTMSCPHGKYDASVVRSALDAGYRLIFTSQPALNRSAPAVSHLLARVGFDTPDISDDGDRFDPARLLALLVRRPIVRLG